MRDKRRQIVLAMVGLGALVALILGLWHSGVWRMFMDRTAFEDAVKSLGAWGPAVIVLAEVLQVLAAPVPGQIVGLVAGYLYGPIWGTLLCMAGLMLGSALAMWLGRRLGRPLIERLTRTHPAQLARMDAYLERRGATALFLIFLLPFLPDDLCCFIAGLTSLRLGELLILAVVGRAPGVAVSALIGAQARSLTWTQMAILGVGTLALAVAFLRYRARLEQAMYALLDRLHGPGARSGG